MAGIMKYVAFQFGLFHLIICTEVSFMSFHGLIAHLFLVLNNVLLLGFVTVYLSTEGHHGGFKFGQ